MSDLARFLQTTKMRQSALAAAVGVTRGHMSALVSGVRKPGLRVALAIERETNGAVTAASWFTERDKMQEGDAA